MPHDRYDCGPACPVAATLDLIGGKWKGSILYLLAEAPARFNVLRRLLGDPPARSLTDQIRELEAAGLVWREVDGGSPPGVTYGLTERGRSLVPVLDALADWGVGRLVAEGAALPDDRRTRARVAALGAEA